MPESAAIEPVPADEVGAATLETMASARRYNQWQFDRIAPFLGRRVCEIGSGIGNLSRLLAAFRPELLVLTDPDPYYLDRLGSWLGRNSMVKVEPLRLPDPAAHERFNSFQLDTVVALNVVEHIEDDLGAVASVAEMLVPGGRTIILVPALPLLYGSLDIVLGHHRRYTRKQLAELCQRAGLEIEVIRYFNLVGSLGWYLNARLRKAVRIPPAQLRVFDALVPALRLEDRFNLPLGQSLIVVARRPISRP